MYLLLTVLAVQQPAPPLASPVSDTAHVVIVATTDVHGRVLGWDYVRDAAAPGGLSRAATMVETLRAQYPEQVVLVDAGDLIEGNLFAAYFAERDSQRPHPVVDALNAMQYDAATPGNHEFDFGTAVLARATGDATYHYVSANIFKGASDTLVYPPHVVVTRSGVKIGITGFTTPGVMVWDRSQVGGRIRVRPIAEAAPPAMRRLDLAGVDLKVVLIHSGLNEPSSYDTAGGGAAKAGPGFSARYGRVEDTPLLDFINEVQRRRAGADLSAAADFDLGAGLPEGEVRERDVTGVYPYENTLRAVRISGSQLRAYLEQSARYFRTYQPGAPLINDSVPGFNFDVVSGVTYTIDLTQAPGQRIRGLAFRGRAVAAADSFTLALNSYRQSGGGGYSMLQGAPVVYDRGEAIRGLLAAEIPTRPRLNAFGIDAAAIGNHEFDWTMDTLRARMAEAHYRFLAANITDSAGTARPDWAEPFTVIERGGVRVAVIGLALPATPETTSPRNVRGLAFGDGARAVRRVLPQARTAADYVIVLAHVGAFCDGDGATTPLGPAACHGEIIDLARSLDSGSVDLIVSGHTHSLVNTVVNGIPIVQARSSGAGIAVVDFVRVTAAGTLRREVRARIETPFADRIHLDLTLVDALRLSQASVSVITDRPVARFGAELRRTGGEYGLGRLIADAQRNVAKSDFALVNTGGTRTDAGAGLGT